MTDQDPQERVQLGAALDLAQRRHVPIDEIVQIRLKESATTTRLSAGGFREPAPQRTIELVDTGQRAGGIEIGLVFEDLVDKAIGGASISP